MAQFVDQMHVLSILGLAVFCQVIFPAGVVLFIALDLKRLREKWTWKELGEWIHENT